MDERILDSLKVSDVKWITKRRNRRENIKDVTIRSAKSGLTYVYFSRAFIDRTKAKYVAVGVGRDEAYILPTNDVVGYKVVANPRGGNPFITFKDDIRGWDGSYNTTYNKSMDAYVIKKGE